MKIVDQKHVIIHTHLFGLIDVVSDLTCQEYPLNMAHLICTNFLSIVSSLPTPYIPERLEDEDSLSYEFRKHKSAYYFEKMELQATP